LRRRRRPGRGRPAFALRHRYGGGGARRLALQFAAVAAGEERPVKPASTSTAVPISSALGTGQIIAAAAALVIAGAVLIAYQLLDMRHALTEGARVQAAIVADSITAPLMFGDHDAADEAL